MLKQHEEVIYILEISISFTPNFRIEITTCKIKYDVVELFERVGIGPMLFGTQRLKDLYSGYKSQYRNKVAGAFSSESRYVRKFRTKKLMKLQM